MQFGGQGETRSQVGTIYSLDECAARDPASLISQAHSVRLSSPPVPTIKNTLLTKYIFNYGAQGGTRTHNPSRAMDFKSIVYANSTTWAKDLTVQNSDSTQTLQLCDVRPHQKSSRATKRLHRLTRFANWLLFYHQESRLTRSQSSIGERS